MAPLFWKADAKSGALTTRVPLEPIPADFETAGGKYSALRVSIEHDKSRSRRTVRVFPIAVERHAGDPCSFEVFTCWMGEKDPAKVGIVVPIAAAARLDRKAIGRIATALVPTLRNAEGREYESALASWWHAGDYEAARAMVRQVTGATWEPMAQVARSQAPAAVPAGAFL